MKKLTKHQWIILIVRILFLKLENSFCFYDFSGSNEGLLKILVEIREDIKSVKRILEDNHVMNYHTENFNETVNVSFVPTKAFTRVTKLFEFDENLSDLGKQKQVVGFIKIFNDLKQNIMKFEF